MPELRWALITLGAAFLAGLGLWEWMRSRRRRARSPGVETATVPETMSAAPRRIEPGFDGMVARRDPADEDSLEVPTILPVEPMLVAVSPEPAVDMPSAARHARPEEPRPAQAPAPVEMVSLPVMSATAPAAPAAASAPAPRVAIQWPPARTDQVLSLRIVHAGGEPLSGRQLRNALEGAGLVPGPQVIYHRVTDQGAVLVSAANLVRPGTLDPALLDAQQFRGVSLFSVLPGPLPAVRMLEELVAVARSLAHRLGAVVQDEHGAEFDAGRLVDMRRALPDEDEGGAA
jgi:cell division protein ZipA